MDIIDIPSKIATENRKPRIIIKERLSVGVSVPLSRRMNRKLDIICKRTMRTKGSMIRYIINDWFKMNNLDGEEKWVRLYRENI